MYNPKPVPTDSTARDIGATEKFIKNLTLLLFGIPIPVSVIEHCRVRFIFLSRKSIMILIPRQEYKLMALLIRLFNACLILVGSVRTTGKGSCSTVNVRFNPFFLISVRCLSAGLG
jgi:hypothetical protein